ncbi:MAG: hypothetical protein A3G24_18875 [Betaproteobacteria bacterium RIFCSPLOWO2_12_FULL_62_13]|nr:MAG: hypothetical protein A3G24_18875 [Betaproteobacteria bacterium RIFCSPLOWO2_12_FULL_62_13]
MVGAFRFHSSEWLTGGLHLIIIAVAAQAEDAAVWPWALAAMAIVSFFAWMASYRRYRQIHDLPTSKVASAAQGYVELFGRSELLRGGSLASTRTGLPCCWFRYYIERRTSGNKWEYVDSGESHEHFLLVDETGECVVSPEGAEVMTDRKETWTQGDYRHTQWLLLPKGTLYAIGEFSTASGAVGAFDERADVSDLLGEWKKDKEQLLQRFDLNRDGEIDMKEWERARLEAQQEVRRRHAEGRAATTEGVHLLRKPGDGRLFLLASELPDKLGRRFALWSAAHLVVFFGAGGASLLMLV